MQKVEWSEDLSIGEELIDAQHKTLIDRLNSVAKAMDEQQGEREIVRTLDFLTEYAAHHFSEEEMHMEAAGYPDLEVQRRSHSEFMKAVKNLEDDYRDEGPTRPLAESVDTFLFNWLTKHIKGLDREFAQFLTEKNIQLTDG